MAILFLSTVTAFWLVFVFFLTWKPIRETGILSKTDLAK